MQVALPERPSPSNGRFTRNLTYFLIAPLTALVIATLVLAVNVAAYQSQHHNRIYTGVSVMGVDLSQMTLEEAQAALAQALPYAQAENITFTDPISNQTWTKSPTALGVSVNAADMAAEAYAIGRHGGPLARLGETFTAWYYGRSLAPTIILDEGQLEQSLTDIAVEINQPAVNAAFTYDGSRTTYVPSQAGRQVDVALVRSSLVEPLTTFRPVAVTLPIVATQPQVADTGETAVQIQQALYNPITFYLPQPLVDVDLGAIELSSDQLAQWVRVEMALAADGAQQPQLVVDENAVRYWLYQYANQLYRAPVNARYYFDDDTKELVLVAPHVNGRELDIDATMEHFLAQVNTPNRSVPLMVKAIEPLVHSNATAAELGITELVSEKVTWFYGSSDERKHNIARAAANFYGIVIAPYEEFSFNNYLGSISETDGYSEGLIIVGGQTIKGIGGGICQVSTTIYQTAFWAGFPITSRLEHGYWLSYYNDGEGPGMDATIYTPIVDLKFINNTPYHLLLENYYSAENEALTFKFYSTSMGRTIEKVGPIFEDVTEVPGTDQDRWEFDPDLPEGTAKQIDWATEGANVFVTRIVKNASGDVIEERTFISRYIPYPNTYHYGPGVQPYDYSVLPKEDRR
ncbi:MAG: VanW family protein [Chloroflexi bacterium]|nr:VanW family protein [Chloroflexota bacterium]